MVSSDLQTRYLKAQLAFLDGQMLMDPSVNDQVGFDFQGLRRSYFDDPKHGQSKFVAHSGRVWIYDVALSIYADLKSKRFQQAVHQADRVVQLAQREEERGFQGLWHFSYNTKEDSFIDPRGPTGANAWCLNALYACALERGDRALLAWLNQKVESYLFGEQVINRKDPRHGLIRSGRYNADDLAREDSMGYDVYRGDLNHSYEHVILEHCADAAGTFRLAFRANRRLDPKNKPFLEILIERHDWLIQGMRRCFWQGDHFVSALDGQGQLYRGRDGQPSVAVDNNTWSAHIFVPYDLELARSAARYVEDRFITQVPPAMLEDLPSDSTQAGSVQEGLEGLYYFPDTFADPFVQIPDQRREKVEKLLHPEAALGFVLFLLGLADHLSGSEQERLRQRALKLYEDTANLQGLYGAHAAPYASVNIPPIFSTLHSVTTAACGVITTRILQGAPSDDFIGVMPPKEMTVAGQAPARSIDD